MKQFHCRCGSEVFFDSHQCLQCGTQLGFDPASRAMVALSDRDDLQRCGNGLKYGVCNWLRPVADDESLCLGCQFNRTIPNLDIPGNPDYWGALEASKKRLLYTLLDLGLPLVPRWQDPDRGLLFDFLDDARSNPDIYPDSFVSTGYADGVITIHVLEADDVARTQVQVELKENFRTLLGHFRHESGHYYWSTLGDAAQLRAEFDEVFGDEGTDYSLALKEYYRDGPPDNWPEQFISAYASSHPAEDWAETWGHYLHLYDALETASAQGLSQGDPATMSMAERIAAWQSLSIAINEVNRSIGRGDAYPFVISPAVAAKLEFVDRVIARLRTHW